MPNLTPLPQFGPPEPDGILADTLHPNQTQPTSKPVTFDPFQTSTDKDEYSRANFYVKTVIGRRQGGTPRNIQVPFDQNQHAIMAQLIQQRVIPAYQTVQDLIRDAVYHRIHDLTTGDEDVPIWVDDPVVVRLATIERLAARAEMAHKTMTAERAQVEMIRTSLEAGVDIGHRNEIRRLLEDATNALDHVEGLVSKAELRAIITEYTEQLTNLDRGI
jgi:hypothetical protein